MKLLKKVKKALAPKPGTLYGKRSTIKEGATRFKSIIKKKFSK